MEAGLPDVPDPFALVTASEAAQYADVTVEAILNWRRRGHLPVAGRKNGRRASALLDVAKAEHAGRERAAGGPCGRRQLGAAAAGGAAPVRPSCARPPCAGCAATMVPTVRIT